MNYKIGYFNLGLTFVIRVQQKSNLSIAIKFNPYIIFSPLTSELGFF